MQTSITIQIIDFLEKLINWLIEMSKTKKKYENIVIICKINRKFKIY